MNPDNVGKLWVLFSLPPILHAKFSKIPFQRLSFLLMGGQLLATFVHQSIDPEKEDRRARLNPPSCQLKSFSLGP